MDSGFLWEQIPGANKPTINMTIYNSGGARAGINLDEKELNFLINQLQEVKKHFFSPREKMDWLVRT